MTDRENDREVDQPHYNRDDLGTAPSRRTERTGIALGLNSLSLI
jgi:hypothetical protein